MNFTEAVQLIFKLEGGYVNDPHDRGGETKWGISKRRFPDVDIKNLTKAGAADIYLRHYWSPTRCDELPENMRLPVFDCAVNQGVKTAVEILQELVGVAQDGQMGPVTLAAVRSYRGDLRHHYHAKRTAAYVSYSQFDRYGRGWLHRLVKVALADGQTTWAGFV